MDAENRPSEAFEPDHVTTNTSLTYKTKLRSVLKEYILHSIGELLLLPSLVCSLYGFINEKAGYLKMLLQDLILCCSCTA